MPKIQILLSHPDYANSRANKLLANTASKLEGVEVAHLEGLYPDGKINSDVEVTRLLNADCIVLQFPIQWYSTPPLLKAWQDAVLTHMFYINPETEGNKIKGRKLLVAATSGNKQSAYTPEGINLFSLQELLKPLHSTANRCGLIWEDPFLVFEARHTTDELLQTVGQQYMSRLLQLTKI